MTKTKSAVRSALLAGLAVEIVNFYHPSMPIDVDLPSGIPWYIKLLALQWVFLHALGIFATEWIDNLGFAGHDRLVVFIGGYFTTTLAFIAIIFSFRWFRHLAEKYSVDAGNP
jgi:hypothetical protein